MTESFDTFDFQILSISMKVIPINKSMFPFIAEVCRFKICYGQMRYWDSGVKKLKKGQKSAYDVHRQP